jgi:flavorubredoxin
MSKGAAYALLNTKLAEGPPLLLLQHGDHRIYWLGIQDETAFRCNVYLIVDGHRVILVDPGNRSFFPAVREALQRALGNERAVTDIILCHQDPDVAASMVDWLDVDPKIRILTSPRSHVLLPHYGRNDYTYYDICVQPELALPSGARLQFIEAPFLHFSGAFTTYDSATHALFSGDIWAALDLEWQLVVDDFEEHIAKMDLFHLDYMACNLAARGFVRNLMGLDIRSILPQHGSIISGEHVPRALDYLKNLQCGVDLIYADLED